jgi:hypothetical protein
MTRILPVEDYLERRKSRVKDCDSLFMSPRKDFYFEDSFSGAILAEYIPACGIGPKRLPQTLVSGRLSDEGFWTDGAILVRYFGFPSSSEAIIKLDTGLNPLLDTELRIQQAYLLFHPVFHNKPYVLMVSEGIWRLFDVRYVDYAVRTTRKMITPEFWLNSLLTGVILKNQAQVFAYISMMFLERKLYLKINALVEKIL